MASSGSRKGMSPYLSRRAARAKNIAGVNQTTDEYRAFVDALEAAGTWERLPVKWQRLIEEWEQEGERVTGLS